MSEFNSEHEKQQAPGGVKALWERYRLWLAGLSRGGRIRWRVCQTLAVVAILAAGVTLGLRAWIRLPTVPEPPELSGGVHLSGGGAQGQPANVEYTGAELPNVTRSGRKDGYYTFLLCGLDVVSNSTDTMILITYDTENKTINAVSLLRDTMINTSAKRGPQKRLNVVYTRNRGDSKLSDRERTEAGMDALKLEVSKLTGIYPDFYVIVEWEAIGNLVEAIGGVYFDVPYDMHYDDDSPSQNLHIHQAKGYRLLNGQDAMEVIRFRKSNKDDPHGVRLGDSGRTKIQRDFLAAVVKKCLTPEILLKLPSLVQIFKENVETDLTVGNILAFAQLAIGMDAENDVVFTAMPYYNVMYDTASLACAQEKEMLELVNGGLNPYLDEIKSSDLQLMYKKSGGGFGVTNSALADPAVARGSSGSSAQTRPSGDEGKETKPSDSDPVDTMPVEPSGDPAEGGDPGNDADPGGTDDPPDIGSIDPGDIFPEPPPDIGEPGPEEQDTQAAARETERSEQDGIL